MLNATPPMFVLVIAWVVGKTGQEVTGRKAVAVALGLLGVVVTIGFGSPPSS